MPILRDGLLVGKGGVVIPPSHAVAAVAANGATNGNGHRATSTSALSRTATTSPRLNTLSALVDRLGWLNQWGSTLGLTYDGLRNVDQQLGYQPTLTIKDYRRRYRRGGIARRIIKAAPLATWSADAKIAEDSNATKETEFEQAARELFDSLGVWQKFYRADVLAGLGHYSIIVIGDGTNIEQPLPKRLKKLIYLTPYAEDNATIDKWDTNPTSMRFMQPEYYSVKLGAVDITDSSYVLGNRPQTKDVKVHHSRVIHIAEGLLENEVYGEPQLEDIWDYLDDLKKVVGGGSEAAWKRMDPGMQIDVDPELDLDEGEIESLQEQLDEYEHGLRRFLQTRGTKLSLLSTTVAGFGPNASAILDLICGTKGIPQRVLLGSERGELASTQDRDNWSDRIIERRRMFANSIIRQFVDLCIERRLLPQPKGSPSEHPSRSSNSRVAERKYHDVQGKYHYAITWPKVRSLDDRNTAEVISKLAGANQANSQANGGLLLTATEIRSVVGLGEQPQEAKVPYGKQPTQGNGGTSNVEAQPAE